MQVGLIHRRHIQVLPHPLPEREMAIKLGMLEIGREAHPGLVGVSGVVRTGVSGKVGRTTGVDPVQSPHSGVADFPAQHFLVFARRFF